MHLTTFTIWKVLLCVINSHCLQVNRCISPQMCGLLQVFGGTPEEGSDSSSYDNMYIGNLLLLLNVFAMSMYYIRTKPLLLIYPPLAVAAWAYAIAANCMGVTAFLVTQNHPEYWNLPGYVMGPLIYWIFVCSVMGYYIIAWSMKHLPSSQVIL